MRDFYNMNFSDYPSKRIKINGTIDEKPEENSQIILEENTSSNIRYLVVPFHRFTSNNYVIGLPNSEISISDLSNIIYDFYNNKELTLLDLKKLNEDDVWEYITKKTIQKKENPELIIHPKDIMGDKIFMEFLSFYEDESGDLQVTLHLGS